MTVTAVEEALQAAAAGADALAVQGSEAGGHRGSFEDCADLPPISLGPLLQLVRAAVELPLIAAGGLACAEAIAATLVAGARAAQVGTAFMLAPEAGTDAAHRAAIASTAPTELTRSFTGRLARGIRNAFMSDLADAPAAYPEIHYMTAPLRAAARRAGDADGFNLWAGEAHQLARARPAAATVSALAAAVPSPSPGAGGGGRTS